MDGLGKVVVGIYGLLHKILYFATCRVEVWASQFVR